MGKLDSIIQTAEFCDQNAIASIVRDACGYCDAELSDSQLVASYALLLTLEGLNELYGWQSSLADALTMAPHERVPNTPIERNLRFEAIRVEQRYKETAALRTHAEYEGKASSMLTIAESHKNIERLDSSASGYRLADKQQAAIKAPLIKRAKNGGLNGSRSKKLKAAEDALEICIAAKKIKQSEPEISNADMVSRLVESQILSAPTIRKYLRTKGLYPAGRNNL